MDELLIGQTLERGWVVQEPRHVQRDAPSAAKKLTKVERLVQASAKSDSSRAQRLQ
jgi:hypothetical protein